MQMIDNHPKWFKQFEIESEEYARGTALRHLKAFKSRCIDYAWMHVDFIDWATKRFPRASIGDIWNSCGGDGYVLVRQYLRAFLYETYPDYLDRSIFYLSAVAQLSTLLVESESYIKDEMDIIEPLWHRTVSAVWGNVSNAIRIVSSKNGVSNMDFTQYHYYDADFWVNRSDFDEQCRFYPIRCPIEIREEETRKEEQERIRIRQALINQVVRYGLIQEIQAQHLSNNDLKLLREQGRQIKRDRTEKRKADRAERVANRIAAGKAKRQDILAMIPGTHTEDEWQAIIAWYGGRCLKCGKESALSKDHVIPVTWKGASNDYSNLQPLCRSCNSSKGNYSDADYRPSPPPPREQLLAWYREHILSSQEIA